MSKSLILHFDGLEAKKHAIGMSDLGHSLIGLDRIVNHGLIALSQNRMPKQRERFPLNIVTQPPAKGSVEIYPFLGEFAAIPGLLPLVAEIFYAAGGEIMWRWISCVLLTRGGRMRQADPHFTRLAELMENIDENRMADQQAWREMLLGVIDRLGPAAADAVRPVGKTCTSLLVEPPNRTEGVLIDEPTADIIRSKEPLELSDMQTLILSVDGFTHHDRKLKVKHPDYAGRYINADVRDPEFDQAPNAYTRAASNRSDLAVMARLAYAKDELKRIYIMGLVNDDS